MAKPYRPKVTAKKRRRIVPLLKEIVESLAMLRESSSFSDPEDPVFASCSGKPTDTHNATNRVFRQLSKQLGFKVGWHGLRNTHATLLNYDDQLSVFDRTAQMGHASSQMTDHYTKKDLERRRGAIERVMEGLLPSEPTGVM